MEESQLKEIKDGMHDIGKAIGDVIEKISGEYTQKLDTIIELLESIESNTR